MSARVTVEYPGRPKTDLVTGEDEVRYLVDLLDNHRRLKSEHAELLEALQALEIQALQSSVNDPANEWGREALVLARAAITKAEGRS